MDAIPIWAIFVGTLVIVLIAIETGYRAGALILLRKSAEKESAVSVINGVILTFSAFMLAFTFSVVWERYDAKRALVREDAAAIRTAWKRSDFLPEADRAEAVALLRQYVDLRVTFAQEDNFGSENVASAAAEIERIQDRLWNMAVANARIDMNSDVAALYIDSLNVMNGIHASRIAVGIKARVPVEIWSVLLLVTLLGMFGIGFQTGIAESSRSVVWPVLALAFAFGFALIATLDRPDSGILNVSQRPLIDVSNSMAAAAAVGK